MTGFEGRVAVVTGSSRGIGRAIAEALAGAGARVVVNARTQEAAGEAAAAIGGGVGAVGLGADVATEAGAQHLVESAIRAFGRLDILVNNAGLNVVAPAVDLAPADWRRIIDLNLSGPFYCSQQAARAMLADPRGGEVILNVASVTAFAPFPGRAAYAASKAALVMLTRVLAAELAPQVRVVGIAPGYVRTDMVLGLHAAGKLDLGQLERRTPQGRLADPAEIARGALFLLSPDAAYVTGETLVMDGGWLSYGFV